MKDPIIQGLLRELSEEYELSSLDKSKQFEHLANFCILSRLEPDNFELDLVDVSGGNDMSIDGIGIAVNDRLVYSKEQVDDILRTINRFDVRFVFVQSKTSAEFDSAGVGNFLLGLRQFFDQEIVVPVNDRVTSAFDVKNYIFSQALAMDRRPQCQMYYVTTGKWLNPAHVVECINKNKGDLLATNLFSDIDFHPIDAEALRKLYREIKNRVEKDILFERQALLPMIKGVREAYIGVVPCREYLKLIVDSEGELNRSLFDDNVRDFQGYNPVNQEIAESIRQVENEDRFVILNNGITVVAQQMNRVGTRSR
jgi:hypothetical protein